ncbi:hypothetical protein C5E16_10970 [Clavibacter michiganensis]|uniref:Uncharacterized protein n=1 Tax=Clavibacter michiganensis TaxID=28447 RepID=A0A2S5VSA0_9MICO|nr:hypothetical protein [Clavibacter michiganensis]PPF66636.1 hypothetical protein C5E16_10970 [Clavibacter michiganensis]
MTTAGPDPAADYLARLDDALREVPFGTAREIRAGIEEELASLAPADCRQRIAELGPPSAIAAEAADGSPLDPVPTVPTSGYGRSRGYVVLTAVTIGIGGVVVPVFGWIVGLVLLWTGQLWTRLERAIVTLAPVLATLIAVGIWWFVQRDATAEPAPARGSGFYAPEVPTPAIGGLAPWWTLLIGAAIGNVVVGLYLLVTGMRRTRG